MDSRLACHVLAATVLLLTGCLFATGGGLDGRAGGTHDGSPDASEGDGGPAEGDGSVAPGPEDGGVQPDPLPPDGGSVDPPDEPPPDEPPPDEPPDDPPPPVCTYPTGPYGFGPGSVVPPMSWPSAVAGAGETGTADLRALHCDPEVRSIFLFVGNDT